MLESWTAVNPLRQPGAFARRLGQSVVAWAWALNFFRLASGLLLLPLILNRLTKAELGMYYVLLSQAALAWVIDFGFAPTIARFVGFAMGGAESIQAQGVTRTAATGPNYRLLWELFFTTRALYRYLSLLALGILGAWGTYVVELGIASTPSPAIARAAWAATLLTTCMEVYANWSLNFLRGMDRMLPATQIGVLGAVIKFGVSAGLLLTGGGLLSIPIGAFLGSGVQQVLGWRLCRRALSVAPAPQSAPVRDHLKIIWPNSWRTGVQMASVYLTTNANTAVCLGWLGLSANAVYGLSIQLVTIITSMAAVWTSVKWPLISQYRARHDHTALRELFWPRMWLQNLTFLAMATALLLLGPSLLARFGSGKEMLPPFWMCLLVINGFLESQFSLWGTLISTENRLPFLWPAVGANVLSLLLSVGLIQFTGLGLGALVLGPLLSGLLFNYWNWPREGARSLGTSWTRFTFTRPSTEPRR